VENCEILITFVVPTTIVNTFMVSFEQEIQTNSKIAPRIRAGLNIIHTSYWLNDRLNSFFKGFDLSQPQYNVLRILRGQRGRPINLKDIHSRMIERNSNTTRLVEKLRIKELVDRTTCAENRRKVEISITKKGLALLGQIDPELSKMESEIFKRITKSDAVDLNILLNKLRG